MLSFEKVSLSFGRRTILQNVHFELAPKEIVALLGESGAGKSSIFRLLIGEWKPTLGSIRLDDFRLESLSLENLQKYRRQIGIVFQDFRLLPQKTVFENVSFALEVCGEEEKIPQVVPSLLRLTGLYERKDQFPHSLSGGEKQRVAIARALVHNPKILIADEATGNLDPKNSRDIADLFARLHREKGLTIILATHDPTLVMRTNPRIIRLHQGKILFDEKKCPPEKAFQGLL
ncbi:ATP-binding cassette domain-containing protein [Candidatus Gracilibacteria bacterium]|nr:ATP-binding cassette domain-containing protein [Candidatus Gracilibacteria bacterium]MCF7819191.1 ATP-binding cassette domain-containing protein [Candidatus Gracilibacteria bacterium]